MDWTPYMSGFFALGGAIVAGLFLLLSQMVVQRNENKRALRKIAYEAAMLEWRTRIENKIGPKSGRVYSPYEVLKVHLAMAGHLSRYDITTTKGVDALFKSIPDECYQWNSNVKKHEEDTSADDHPGQSEKS